MEGEVKSHIEIPGLGNYYGNINVLSSGGKYYAIIENYDTDFKDIDLSDWEEIPAYLYRALLQYREEFLNK